MDLEDQIRTYKELSKKIEEFEQQRKQLGANIMEQMQEKTVRIGQYVVKRYSRLSIKLSLEEARLIGAIKTEETVDKEKIKELYKQGEPISGISEIHYIQISAKTNDSRQRPTEECGDPQFSE